MMFNRFIFLAAALLSCACQAYAEPSPEPDKQYAISKLIENCKSSAASRMGEAKLDKKALAERCNQHLVEDVKNAIAQGASVSAADPYGRTALRFAVFLDRSELNDVQYNALMDLLMTEKAGLNATNEDGETLLMLSAYIARPSFIKRLLENGANPNAMTAPLLKPQKEGRPVAVNPKKPVSTLNYFVTSASNEDSHEDVADRVACIRLLVQYGADLNVKNSFGATILMRAVLDRQKPEISIAMIDMGADVHVVDQYGNTALSYASSGGNVAVIKKLFDKGANANTQSSVAGLGFTPLLSAISSRHEEAAMLILENTNIATLKKASESHAYHVTGSGDTPLLGAMRHKMIKLIPLLIDKGADLNAVGNSAGQTPLMYACSQKQIDMLKLLISKGAQVNAQTEYGETALMHVARWAGHAKVMELLIQHGAKVNLKDKGGSTALDIAKSNSKYNEENIALLIKYGAIANNPSSHCTECSSH